MGTPEDGILPEWAALTAAKDALFQLSSFVDAIEALPSISDVKIGEIPQYADQTLDFIREWDARTRKKIGGTVSYDAVVEDLMLTVVHRARRLGLSWAKIAATRIVNDTPQELHRAYYKNYLKPEDEDKTQGLD